MTFEELGLLEFHVTDIAAHVNTNSPQELALSAKSSVSARTAEPFDGTLYLFMKVLVTGQTEELFRLEVDSETVMKLPGYKTEVTEEDAPPLHRSCPQGDSQSHPGAYESHGHCRAGFG